MAEPRTPTVPLLDLSVLYDRHREEIDTAVRRVLQSQQFILGPEVDAFESEMADYLGNGARCNGVSNGTDALMLAAKALDLQPDDEVIVPAYTFVATASAFAFMGLRPVFADIRRESLTIDPDHVSCLVNERTKAIVPVHLFGRAADMSGLTRALAEAGRPDIPIVEDAAQALGGTYQSRRLGTFGQLACFSFFPSKNLGGFGDGGLIVTTDEALSDRVRMLRNQGRSEPYRHSHIGLNARLDALQAAILRTRLGHLDEWVTERRELAARYRERLAELALLDVIDLPPADPSDNSRHCYHQFSIRTDVRHRDALRSYLTEAGIGTAVYYPIPLPNQPCFAYLGHREGEFPVAESAARESLALPIYPGLTTAQQDYVIESIASFFRAGGG